MPNSRDLGGVGRDGDEVPGHGRAVAAQARQQPVAGGLGVGHRLQRGEGLRGDDEQRFRRVEIAHGLGEVGAVDVRDEAERQVAVAVVPQGLVGHDRAQIGAADADVDDVANRACRCGPSMAAADALGRKRPSCRARHGPGARRSRRRPRSLRSARRPQGHVQDGPVFGDVDLLAAEHGVDAALAGPLPRPDAAAGARVSSVMRFFE